MTTLEQRVSRLEGVLTNTLATKADLADLKGDIARVESRLENRIEAEIRKLESRLLRWMIGMVSHFNRCCVVRRHVDPRLYRLTQILA